MRLCGDVLEHCLVYPKLLVYEKLSFIKYLKKEADHCILCYPQF